MFSLFERIVSPFGREPIAVRPASVFDFLIRHTTGIRKYMILVALFSTFTAATEVYIFKFIGGLVDEMKLSDSFIIDNSSSLVQITVLLLVLLPIVISAHTLLWHQTLDGNFPVKTLFNIHQHLIKQSVTFYNNESSGKIANTLMQTVQSARLVVMKLVDTFMFALVFSITMVLMLASLNLYLLIPVAVWFIGYVLVIIYFVPKLRYWSNKQASSRSEMVGQLVDTYSNIVTVKLFSHSNVEKQHAQNYMTNYLHTNYGQMRFMSKVQFFMWGLNILLIFSTIAFSLLLWHYQLISVGAIAAAVAVVFRVYTLSHWIMWEIAGFFGNIGIIQDGLKLFSESSVESINENAEPLSVNKYDVSFCNVSFSYNKNKKVLKNFSIQMKAGEKIGIIGRSGSGKSTLVKLLLRFHETEYGVIKIGGQNIQNVSHESLLASISVVTQDVELLDRSVRDNLIYGSENVSDEEMVLAARAAGAHDFILELVDGAGNRGYDARVGVKGANISGGQKQRISLARSLIKKSSILIFDEATSALDAEMESRIMESIKSYIENKTVIIITHKMAIIADVDRIGVLDKGELVEIGTPEELKTREGFYYAMLKHQSEKNQKNKINELIEV